MNVVNKPYQLSFDALLEDLAKLPTTARVSGGLNCAARLIEDAAYAFAREVPGGPIVALMLLAAEVEKIAEQITKSSDADQLMIAKP